MQQWMHASCSSGCMRRAAVDACVMQQWMHASCSSGCMRHAAVDACVVQHTWHVCTYAPSASSCVRESESWSSRSTSKSHSSRPCVGTLGQAADEDLPVQERREKGLRGARLSSDRVARPSAKGLKLALTGVAEWPPRERGEARLRQISCVRRSTPSSSAAPSSCCCWWLEEGEALAQRVEAGRGSRGTWLTRTQTMLEGWPSRVRTLHSGRLEPSTRKIKTSLAPRSLRLAS